MKQHLDVQWKHGTLQSRHGLHAIAEFGFADGGSFDLTVSVKMDDKGRLEKSTHATLAAAKRAAITRLMASTEGL